MLGVYIFAYTTGETDSTGALYISLMIIQAITAIPASILNAALPIATRRNKDPFTNTLRISLALAIPIIAAATAAPHTTAHSKKHLGKNTDKTWAKAYYMGL